MFFIVLSVLAGACWASLFRLLTQRSPLAYYMCLVLNIVMLAVALMYWTFAPRLFNDIGFYVPGFALGYIVADLFVAKLFPVRS